MYRYAQFGAIIRESDGAEIMPDPNNSDYAALIASGAEIAPYEPNIAQERTTALSALLNAVSAVRVKYAPNAAFQGPAYDIKAAEADAYVAAGRPADTSAFPLLAASAQANNRTVSAHADLVLAKRDAWIPLLAATENLREAGENAIKAADTVEAINAARDAYVGQLAQI